MRNVIAGSTIHALRKVVEIHVIENRKAEIAVIEDSVYEIGTASPALHRLMNPEQEPITDFSPEPFPIPVMTLEEWRLHLSKHQIYKSLRLGTSVKATNQELSVSNKATDAPNSQQTDIVPDSMGGDEPSEVTPIVKGR